MDVTLEAWRIKICFIPNIFAFARGHVILYSFRFVVRLKKINNGEKLSC